MLGEPADEEIPSPGARARLAPYLAPELFDPAAYAIFAIDTYRRDEYAGEYRVESDIYALGATTIEVRTQSLRLARTLYSLFQLVTHCTPFRYSPVRPLPPSASPTLQ
jgi:serine/threonine protein kinase